MRPAVFLGSLELMGDDRALQDHVANKLDATLFPYVKDSPSAAPAASSLRSSPAIQPAVSLRSQKPNWHKAARGPNNAQQDSRQRIIVFVAGGMTYSEMREAYLLSKSLNKEIIIGVFSWPLLGAIGAC